MKGLELSEKYYNEYGKEMLDTLFADVKDRITVGLVGEGSECLGYDDETSADHDFEPSFCLWIDEEDERKFGFKLERAYAKLPKEFMGYKKQLVSPAGGARRGVLVTEDFYKKLLGSDVAPKTLLEWLRAPTSYLAALTSGKIFKEGEGKFMEVRHALLQGYPEDVRKKKLAAHLALMSQSGQYNYARCAMRGESGAAQLALFDFVKNGVKAIYLLNGKYCPFYKWMFRGMRDLEKLSELEQPLVYLLETGNEPSDIDVKTGIIEDTASMLIEELKNQNLSDAMCNNLDTHAFSVTDKIKDGFLRNMHVMDGV